MELLNRGFDISAGSPTPMPYLITSHKRLVEAALALLANNGQTGGIHGLMEHFEQAGLTDTIHSWIKAGENLPISGVQLQQVLDAGHLRQIAEETGFTEEEAANRLSELLPCMVDQFTPDGHLPQNGLGNMSDLRELYKEEHQ